MGRVYLTKAVVEAGPRPDGGATLEVYSNREFVEFEHLGVLVPLAPGTTAVLREDWWVIGNVHLPVRAPGLSAMRDALDDLVRIVTAGRSP
jgi:hypothetical protein